MKTKAIYVGLSMAGMMLLSSLQSRGSERGSQPRLLLIMSMSSIQLSDTLPKSSSPSTTSQQVDKPGDPVVKTGKDIIKEVPKSKNQVKPVKISNKIPVKVPIVKPRITIRRIGNLLP